MPRALLIRPDTHRAVEPVIARFDRDVAGPHARNAFSYPLSGHVRNRFQRGIQQHGELRTERISKLRVGACNRLGALADANGIRPGSA